MVPVELGSRVRDRISGFSGIVVARAIWLNGCTRVGIQSEVLCEGKPLEPQWFDEPQVDVVPEQPAESPSAPAAPRPGGGPRRDPASPRIDPLR
jgi:hypothetical protein